MMNILIQLEIANLDWTRLEKEDYSSLSLKEISTDKKNIKKVKISTEGSGITNLKIKITSSTEDANFRISGMAIQANVELEFLFQLQQVPI